MPLMTVASGVADCAATGTASPPITTESREIPTIMRFLMIILLQVSFTLLQVPSLRRAENTLQVPSGGQFVARRAAEIGRLFGAHECHDDAAEAARVIHVAALLNRRLDPIPRSRQLCRGSLRDRRAF